MATLCLPASLQSIIGLHPCIVNGASPHSRLSGSYPAASPGSFSRQPGTICPLQLLVLKFPCIALRQNEPPLPPPRRRTSLESETDPVVTLPPHFPHRSTKLPCAAVAGLFPLQVTPSAGYPPQQPCSFTPCKFPKSMCRLSSHTNSTDAQTRSWTKEGELSCTIWDFPSTTSLPTATKPTMWTPAKEPASP